MIIFGMNSLDIDWAPEALISLAVNTSSSNQRLETLGDPFPKLETSVYFSNKLLY